MTKAEGRQPELIEQAILVTAGLPEIIELQHLGWIYVKP
jgi:intracellular sulfur oxidation DsrE/DsrF family protein